MPVWTRPSICFFLVLLPPQQFGKTVPDPYTKKCLTAQHEAEETAQHGSAKKKKTSENDNCARGCPHTACPAERRAPPQLPFTAPALRTCTKLPDPTVRESLNWASQVDLFHLGTSAHCHAEAPGHRCATNAFGKTNLVDGTVTGARGSHENTGWWEAAQDRQFWRSAAQSQQDCIFLSPPHTKSRMRRGESESSLRKMASGCRDLITCSRVVAVVHLRGASRGDTRGRCEVNTNVAETKDARSGRMEHR